MNKPYRITLPSIKCLYCMDLAQNCGYYLLQFTRDFYLAVNDLIFAYCMLD